MRAALSSVKHILKSIYVQVVLLPLVYLYYVLKLRRKNTFHLIVCNHIGDFMFAMGYVNEYREQNHLSEITIIGAPKFKEIFDRYQFDRAMFCACSGRWLKRLEEVNQYVSGRMMYRYLADVLVIAPGNDYVMGYSAILPLADQMGFTLKDLLAYVNMQLSMNAYYEKISAPKADNKKSKKILLCPDAQLLSWKEKHSFFQLFQENAQRNGYETVINSPNSDGGLGEFYDRCPEYTAVVGMRSGLLDLAANSGTFTIALYPPEHKEYMNFCNIETMNPYTSCAQYLLTDSMSYDVEQILKMCEVGK